LYTSFSETYNTASGPNRAGSNQQGKGKGFRKTVLILFAELLRKKWEINERWEACIRGVGKSMKPPTDNGVQ